jgi:ADP-heptose:LPS heptosyltransferase
MTPPHPEHDNSGHVKQDLLIIRFSSMGDVILAAALFTYIKTVNAAARLHFVTNDLYAPLFKDDPRLIAVYGVSAANMQATFAALARTSWTRIIDLQNSRKSRRLCRRYFSAQPTGRFEKHHGERTILLYTRINRYHDVPPVAERYIATAGFSSTQPHDTPPPTLQLPSATDRATGFFNKREAMPILALMPFCAWKNKEWPVEYFRAVGTHFRDQGWNILIAGGPEEQSRAEALARLIGAGAASIAGQLTLAETGSALGACRLALGGDTGLSHLARALGVRTGILFGPTTHHFGFYPFGEPAFRIFERPMWCRPCHAHGGNACWRMCRRCLEGIKPQEVIAGLEQMI